MREWKDGGGSGWEEFFDEGLRKKVYFNSITKETTFDKPVQLMWGKELEEYKKQEEGKVSPTIFVFLTLKVFNF